MMRETVDINDVVVFDPRSFEDARQEKNQWLYCNGVKSWRGEQIPFVAIAVFTRPPFGMETDVLANDIGGWSPRNLDWFSIPCAPTSCAVVIEKSGAYVKLLPLNDDYKPPQPLESVWVSAAVLAHGARVGMLQVFP